MNDQQTAAARDFRAMAAQCRDMATRNARPGALLVRAETFDAVAADIESRREPVKRVGEEPNSRAVEEANASR